MASAEKKAKYPYNQTTFCQRTGIQKRRLIYLCDHAVIIPDYNKKGRGKARRYSEANVIEYHLADGLEKAGFALKNIAKIMSFTRRFLKCMDTCLEDLIQKPKAKIIIVYPDIILFTYLNDNQLPVYSPAMQLTKNGQHIDEIPNWHIEHEEPLAYLTLNIHTLKGVFHGQCQKESKANNNPKN